MPDNSHIAKLTELLPEGSYKLDEPLAKYTSVKIGGPADVLFMPETNDQLISAVRAAREIGISVTMLGWGANVLIADSGIRGLVIKSKAKQIQIGDKQPQQQHQLQLKTEGRHEHATEEQGGRSMYEFADLDYDESEAERVAVTMDSGVDMPFAINYLISEGITGLQWYSRIPATIGGAIFNNIHGGSHFIEEVVERVQILTPAGEIVWVNRDDLEFDYDYSRFHHSGEIILRAEFNLFLGDNARARAVAIEWAKRKSVQPQKSVGCVFANISQQQRESHNYPTTSVGYIVEHVLKMSGFHIGDAYVSPQHHNFIENKGEATAADYLAVMKEIARRTYAETGIKLTPEIVFLGFDDSELTF